MMAAARSNAIDVLKALGALLIINSHLEPFHLRPWMAADGMFGNTIFFFATGFTLAGSLRRHPTQGMGQFLWKRISRMYPGLWIVMALLPPLPVEWSWQKAPGLLLYPTLFTFVAVIVPAYPLYFLALRSRLSLRTLTLVACALLGAGCLIAWQQVLASFSPGISWSGLGAVSWMPHFWGAMLLGACFALKWETDGKPAATGKVWTFCAGACVLYVMLRIMALPAMNARLGQSLQSMAVLAMPMAVASIMGLLLVLDSPLLVRGLHTRCAAMVIAFLAAHTWETYVVHEGIALWKFVTASPYPIGLVWVFALTFVFAPILRRISALPFALKKS